jgi:non-ribosomal peptide synthetase component F
VRSLSHAPLLQVMLVLQNQRDVAAERQLVLPDVAVTRFAAERATAQFELTLNLTETASGLAGTLEYASALFDAASAERLASRFGLLLAGIVANPEGLVADLPVMDAAERALVVETFNATAAYYPRDRTVLDLFEEQAVRTPDAVAVLDGEREVGYGGLASASRRLGRYLIGHGVGPEGVVGVCMERSAELIVSLLGVFQAGAGYLPLDPEYPAARLGFMLADAAATVVIITRAHAATLQAALAADEVHKASPHLVVLMRRRQRRLRRCRMRRSARASASPR